MCRLAASALLLAIAAASPAITPRTEPMDGEHTYDESERLRTTDLTPSMYPRWYFTWDASGATLASLADDFAETSEQVESDQHFLVAYFDMDPRREDPRAGAGTTTGLRLGAIGHQPKLPFAADFALLFRLDGKECALLAANDGAWARTEHEVGHVLNRKQRLVEFALPWEALGGRPERLGYFSHFLWAGGDTGWNYYLTPDRGNFVGQGFEMPSGSTGGSGTSTLAPVFNGWYCFPILDGINPGTRAYINSFPVWSTGEGALDTSDPTSWSGGMLPGDGPHDNLVVLARHRYALSGDLALASLIIERGGLLKGGAAKISLADGGSFARLGLFDAGTSTIHFTGRGFVPVASEFHNLLIGGGLGLAPLALEPPSSVSGELRLMRGGYFPQPENAPVFGPESVLVYACQGDFNVFSEWPSAGDLGGLPLRVEVRDRTRLRFRKGAVRSVGAGGEVLVGPDGAVVLDPDTEQPFSKDTKVVFKGGIGERRPLAEGTTAVFANRADGWRVEATPLGSKGTLEWLDVVRFPGAAPHPGAEAAAGHFSVDTNYGAAGYRLRLVFRSPDGGAGRPHRWDGEKWVEMPSERAADGTVAALCDHEHTSGIWTVLP
ncbi:MAG: hypothetical protein SF028_10235 [Candidatus Sumerlaeia bacterium]|nr:hypothetical protein [Candidatus Sumerlaeia bacterium]